MAACPELVRSIIVSYSDLDSNSTNRRHGAVVSLSCHHGYILRGSPLIKCQNGRWDRPLPHCVSPDDLGSLSETDKVVVIVCCSLALLVFLLLIVLFILYKRRRSRIDREEERVKVLRHAANRACYDPDPFADYSEYGAEFPGWRDYRDFREYRSIKREKSRKGRPVEMETFRRDRNPPLWRSYDDSWSQGGGVTPSVESSSVFALGLALPPKYDTSRCFWPDPYDYSGTRIPRPHIAGKVPGYFLSPRQYNSYG